MKKTAIFLIILSISLSAFGQINPLFAQEKVTKNSKKETTTVKNKKAESSPSTNLYQATPSIFIDPDLIATYSAKKQATDSYLLKSLSSLGLSDVFLLPSSPFYFVKKTWERIRLFFTFDPGKKAQYLLSLNEKRLSEVFKLTEKEKFQEGKDTLYRYESQTQEALRQIEKSREKGKEILDLVRKLEAVTIKEQEVLEVFKAKFSQSGVLTFEEIKEFSLRGLDQALDAVTRFTESTPSFELRKRIGFLIETENVNAELKKKIEKYLDKDLMRLIYKEINESTESVKGEK